MYLRHFSEFSELIADIPDVSSRKVLSSNWRDRERSYKEKYDQLRFFGVVVHCHCGSVLYTISIKDCIQAVMIVYATVSIGS